MDILKKIENILKEYTYKTHKVNHGKRRSQASKLTGTEKLKYKKQLKKKSKERKNNPSMKLKAKKYLKKYKKTSQYKQSKKKYDLYHK